MDAVARRRCSQPLRLTRRTFTGALPDSSDRGQEENLAILPVPLWDTQSEGVSCALQRGGAAHPHRRGGTSAVCGAMRIEFIAAGATLTARPACARMRLRCAARERS